MLASGLALEAIAKGQDGRREPYRYCLGGVAERSNAAVLKFESPSPGHPKASNCATIGGPTVQGWVPGPSVSIRAGTVKGTLDSRGSLTAGNKRQTSL